MTDHNFVKSVMDWFARQESESAAQDWEDSNGVAVVMSYDPEGGGYGFTGPFPDPVTALAYAEEYEEQLNRGDDGGKPFVVTVHPLWAPEYPESEKPRKGRWFPWGAR